MSNNKNGMLSNEKFISDIVQTIKKYDLNKNKTMSNNIMNEKKQKLYMDISAYDDYRYYDDFFIEGYTYSQAKKDIKKRFNGDKKMAVEKEKAHKYEQQIWDRIFKNRGVNADIRMNTVEPVIAIIFLDVSFEIKVKYEKRNGQHVFKALTINQKEQIMDRSTITLDIDKVEETGEALTFIYGFMNVMSDEEAGIRLFLDHVMDQYWRDKEAKREEFPF